MRSWKRGLSCFVAACLLSYAISAGAAVTTPRIFGEHMVLQQGKDIPVWGKAEANEAVTVAIADQKVSATAGADGRWSVKLAPMTAGGPFTMTITGKDSTLTFADVLVGEVWVGSGQSNMQWPVSQSNDSAAEIAAANFPNIHLFSVERTVSGEPKDDCNGAWVVCTPETVPDFSAVAYFFGRTLHQELNVPVGLIHTSWGGTPAEAWTSMPSLASEPVCQPIIDRWQKIIADYPANKAAFDQQMADWQKAADAAKAAGQAEPPKPNAPMDPSHPHRAAGLYNAMIAPIVPYAIQGAIWYQGESNAGRAYQYRKLFPLMIQDWRKAWNQGPFSFYFVQLANFMDVDPEPKESEWAELREAQSMTLALENTGQAVIIDIGEAKDIHPKNKQDVGKRLALNALAKNYGKQVVYSGPSYASMTREGNKAIVTFKNTDGGLVAKGGEPLKGFAVAGADHKFVWADAKINGDNVEVSAAAVAEPVAVRYAWANNPVCNLFNGAGLPASPFRTDDWPGLTVDAR